MFVVCTEPPSASVQSGWRTNLTGDHFRKAAVIVSSSPDLLGLSEPADQQEGHYKDHERGNCETQPNVCRQLAVFLGKLDGASFHGCTRDAEHRKPETGCRKLD
jgi:hypothetical protein